MRKSWRARTREELIVEVWQALDSDSIGTIEIEQIQSAIQKMFGKGAVESPASIARRLADEGVMLRHPEVIECDAAWRARVLAPSNITEALDFSSLEAATRSLDKLESLRRDGVQNDSELAVVADYRKDVLLVANSRIADEATRAEAREIALWLEIWLTQPDLFRDWLNLRKTSEEFRGRFGRG